ncbi:MAG: divalent-cation tolerance protein CutA [Candidatus Omnitrophota bacterium]
MKYIVVYITVPNKKEAENIAKVLVEGKIAACVNILSGVTSIFSWQGKIEKCSELLLIVKTRQRLFKRLAEKVKAIHSYSVPEIIALPIIEGSAPYLNWLRFNTGKQ